MPVNVASNNTVLVIDDNPNNLRVLCALLDQNGYRARPAINGEIALKDITHVSPDLVLLDISMPGIDGFGVCKALKQNPATEHIPVIFISAADDMEDIVKGFDVGGVDYITKPFESRIVLARVRSQLALFSAQKELLSANRALKEIQHNLEITVQERTHDLQKSNVELEGVLSENKRLYASLKRVAESISGVYGDQFFANLAKLMIESLNVDCARVYRFEPDSALILLCGEHVKHSEIDFNKGNIYFANLVCESGSAVLFNGDFVKQAQEVANMGEGNLPSSYAGVPIRGVKGNVLGVIEICSRDSFDPEDEYRVFLELFSLRAASELQRRDVEQKLRESAIDLERQVLERTDALRVVNKELESFSYSVSHDLRAPLRTIQGFSNVLLEDYADKLDEQGTVILNYIIDGSRDMSDLIDGLLALSRSSMGELQRENVNLADLAKIVESNLRVAEPTVSPSVTIDANMHASCDSRLMSNVLMNLMGNAWKYTAKHPHPKIHVGQKKDDSGNTIYFVSDNGAGFDMAYKERLFKPFMRLHRDADYSGSGIGLATVKRIINRHGGDVWAKSVIGEGSTFYFRLGSPDFIG